MTETPIPTMNPTPKAEPEAKPMAETAVERPNSVEISINAKGMWSGKVKVYANTIGEAGKLAHQKAIELEQIIRNKNGG